MFEDFYEKLQNDPKLRKFHQQEKLILDVTELVAEQRDKNKIDNKQLAKLLRKNENYIIRFLDGTSKISLRSIVDIFTILGVELKVDIIPLNFENIGDL